MCLIRHQELLEFVMLDKVLVSFHEQQFVRLVLHMGLLELFHNYMTFMLMVKVLSLNMLKSQQLVHMFVRFQMGYEIVNMLLHFHREQ